MDPKYMDAYREYREEDEGKHLREAVYLALAVIRTAALIIICFLLATGCTPSPKPEAKPQPEVTDLWYWCPNYPTLQCPAIRLGNEMYVLHHGQRMGDGVDVWDAQVGEVETIGNVK